MDYTLVIRLHGTLEERERAKARGGESEIIVLLLCKSIRSSYEVVTRNLLHFFFDRSPLSTLTGI